MMHANNIPGHLADLGKLSEIQELIRVAKMVMIFIWLILDMILFYVKRKLTPRGMILISATENTGGSPLTL
jgi:hypothetical protein